MTDTLSRPAGVVPEGPVPPQALEAERAVLAAMLLDGEAVARAIEMIESPVFYRVAHQKIFDAMSALFGRNEKVDLITLSEELRKRGELEAVGGAPALAQILDYAATSANVEQHARIVHAKSVLRSLIKATGEIQQEAYAGNDETAAILDRAEQRIFQITDQRVRQGFISMKELMMPTMKTIEELAERKALVTGVPSGYDDLDKMTAGFQRSDLVIIAGRPSMGKCVAFDTEIVLDDGSISTVEQLFLHHHSAVSTLTDDFRLERAAPSDWIDDGIKPVFEVETDLGRRVKTTLTHPFLTPNGWMPLAGLAPGDRIAVPRVMPVFGETMCCRPELETIACVPFGGPSGPRRERLRREALGGDTAVASAAVSALHRMSSMPELVFTLVREQLAAFLGIHLSRWAKAVTGGGRSRVTYSTATERVARQLSHLLLRFGVVSRVKKGWIPDLDGGAFGWQMEISAPSALRTLIEEIGAFRGTHFAATVADLDPREDPPTTGDVLWDRIASIASAGDQQVYDLTIPATHNFVANDVCVHNTSFAMNIAENAAIQHQKNVAILSLEMSKEQIALRLLCSQSEVPLYKVRSGHLSEAEFRRLVNLTGGLYKAGILIDDTAAPTVLEIRAKCRRLRAENRLDMVLIDYLQLIRASGRSENRTQEISQITRALKGLAKELDIPVIALSQLSRAPEGRGQGERRPQLSDLRESGSIEQDADVVLFVFREEMYKKDDPSLRGKADIIIAKQRNGPTGDVKLTFLHEFTKFVPYSPVMPGETDPGF